MRENNNFFKHAKSDKLTRSDKKFSFKFVLCDVFALTEWIMNILIHWIICMAKDDILTVWYLLPWNLNLGKGCLVYNYFAIS